MKEILVSRGLKPTDRLIVIGEPDAAILAYMAPGNIIDGSEYIRCPFGYAAEVLTLDELTRILASRAATCLGQDSNFYAQLRLSPPTLNKPSPAHYRVPEIMAETHKMHWSARWLGGSNIGIFELAPWPAPT